MNTTLIILSVITQLSTHIGALSKLLAENPNGISDEQLAALFKDDDEARAVLQKAIADAQASPAKATAPVAHPGDPAAA